MEIKQENENKTPRRDGNNNNNNNNNGITVQSFTHHQTLDHIQRQQGRSPNSDRAAGSNSKPPINVRYRECLKNHAASIGGSVYDGCGEFMPSGEDGTIEALKCAACDCHRNFHRKEVDGETHFTSRRSAIMLNPLQLPPPLPSPTMMHHQKYSISMHTSPSSAIVAPMNVAFGGIRSGGGGGGTESSSEDLNPFPSEGMLQNQPQPPPFALSKKRFRTKFTQEQKDKMMEFAEKVGWRFQKQDEDEIEKFCAEVGIKRHVFKVWMHNNKNNNAKNKQHLEPEPEPEPV